MDIPRKSLCNRHLAFPFRFGCTFGVVGIIGDIFLFEAYVRIGAHYSAADELLPVLTGALTTLSLVSAGILGCCGHRLTWQHRCGHSDRGKKNLKLRVNSYGVFCGLMGAVGQSVG